MVNFMCSHSSGMVRRKTPTFLPLHRDFTRAGKALFICCAKPFSLLHPLPWGMASYSAGGRPELFMGTSVARNGIEKG